MVKSLHRDWDLKSILKNKKTMYIIEDGKAVKNLHKGWDLKSILKNNINYISLNNFNFLIKKVI